MSRSILRAAVRRRAGLTLLTAAAWRRAGLTLLAIGATLHMTSGSVAADAPAVAYGMDRVEPFEFTGDLRDLPQVPPGGALIPPSYRPLGRISPQPSKAWVPPTFEEGALVSPPLASMPSPIQNFPGMSHADTCNGVPCGSGWPPDPNGDVGPNHYIQAVNAAIAIYSKTGTLLASFTENQLWSASGTNPCNGHSQGDPVVLYDRLTDRFILTNLAFAVIAGSPVSPFYQCIAVSKTGDPVSGGWRLYPVRTDVGGAGRPPVGALNDYPKFGIWIDCLYMTANEFQFPSQTFVGAAFASFSRSDLYSGAPLTYALGFINNSSDPFTMIPANLLGSSASLPAPGAPGYFVSESQVAFAYEVRTFTAGLNCGNGGVLSPPTNVSHASYAHPSGAIVPQPQTSVLLDSIDDRLMQRVQYRKLGSAESLWVVHNVVNAGVVTLQWAQLDVTAGTVATTPVQEQIYAPDTTLHRWMGSLAVDREGNMAVGYSTSSGVAPNFPSIAYAGRLAGDLPNTLLQSEVQLVAGGGSQTNSCGGIGMPCDRWGDYTAMTIDPVDDCTFWYTNQYYSDPVNGNGGNWQTRIGSFKFPLCGATPPVRLKTFTVPPCRVVDTRVAGGAIPAGGSRNFHVAGSLSGQGGASDCLVPSPQAKAVHINVVAVGPSAAGHLTVYPYPLTLPLASTLNFAAGQTIANGVLVSICDAATADCSGGDITVTMGPASAHLVIDVTGYLEPPP